MNHKTPLGVGTTTTTSGTMRTASTATAAAATTTTKKKKILCLHGRRQSASILSNKIAGARKKLQRVYDLDFLDAPFETTNTNAVAANNNDGGDDQQQQLQPPPPRQLEWWTTTRNDDGSATGTTSNMKEAFEYVMEYSKHKNYDAIIGFSQGGVLGTAMVVLGAFPTVRAVVTAGSPFRQEPFDTTIATATAADPYILQLEQEEPSSNNNKVRRGTDAPKLHFAGDTDKMVPVDSVRQLCEMGGNGRLIIHEKGHLFPTKAVYVNEMLEFLKTTLDDDDDDDDDDDEKQ
eukprot:CAMPEP_0194336518 /NCGR_PEP_ID=MMETSP0171-20130528/73218_1 /TAXON_ID=218684 /ORGANISM="Corethron pennatum, Strain L29A3" /LENGTH=289 /DNA_ID=CAMNT_0039100003 /DNA_START=46 /DNA_END=915 /DNA_ORIENTATION=+